MRFIASSRRHEVLNFRLLKLFYTSVESGDRSTTVWVMSKPPFKTNSDTFSFKLFTTWNEMGDSTNDFKRRNDLLEALKTADSFWFDSLCKSAYNLGFNNIIGMFWPGTNLTFVDSSLHVFSLFLLSPGVWTARHDSLFRTWKIEGVIKTLFSFISDRVHYPLDDPENRSATYFLIVL